MKLKKLNEARRYGGEALESGGTSIAGGAAPGVKFLTNNGSLNGKILDYGAGKYARNANWLREQGHKVYAYDPYNGSPGGDGWNETTTTPPTSNEKFDSAFTSFVLNVVPSQVEQKIIQDVTSHAKKSFHITRNKDIFAMIKKSLGRGEPIVTKFFLGNFANEEEKSALKAGELTDKTIQEFAEHGVQTSRGFQRIPTSEEFGLKLIKNISNYKIYETGAQ